MVPSTPLEHFLIYHKIRVDTRVFLTKNSLLFLSVCSENFNRILLAEKT